MGFSVVGRELHGVVEMDEGGVALPEFTQQACTLQVRVELSGPQRDDLLIAGHGLSRTMQCTQHRRAVAVGLDEVASQRQGPVIAGKGGRELSAAL